MSIKAEVNLYFVNYISFPGINFMMKRVHSFFAVLSVILLSFNSRQDHRQTFRQLYELQGTWVMRQLNSGLLFEHWEKVNDSLMQGKSYIVNEQKMTITAQENVVLKCSREGIFYIPVVNGQNQGLPVSFKLVSAKSKEFIFENTAHDFPKRVVYKLLSKQSLHAWVDGGNKDSSGRIYYAYQRIN